MKRIPLLAAALAACASLATGMPAQAAPWTVTTSGPAFGSSADTTLAPAAITLTGGDDTAMAGCPDGTLPGFTGGCEIDVTTTQAAQFSFQWSYSTADITPQYDQFGVIVDGVKTQLIANGGDLTQSGSFSVTAHDSFGFYINCTDCTGGAATALIANIAAVPEPATVWLLPLGLAAIGLMRRRVR